MHVSNGPSSNEQGEISVAVREGKVDIFVDESVSDLWVKIYPDADVTLYLPYGFDNYTVILVNGATSYITVWYHPDDEPEKDKKEEE